MAIFRRKLPRLTREQVLRTRPLRNPDLQVTRNETGEVSLRLPRRKVWWLNWLAKLGSVPQYRTLALDKVGSAIWDLCDGEHTVRDLISHLVEGHQLSRKEAELSMLTYLRQLAQRGVVLLAVGPEKEDE